MDKPGNTPLLYWNGLLPKLFYEQVRVKDESKNPTGTYKDRRSAYIVKQAIREKIHSLVLISAGNGAYSLSRYAEGTDIKVTAVVDEQLSNEKKQILTDACDLVIEVNLREKFLSPSILTKMARTRRGEKVWDVTNGFHAAFKAIVDELPDDAPDAVVVPKGGGEAMTGIYEAVQERGWPTNVIGIGSFFNKQLRTRFQAYPLHKEGKKGMGSMITCSAQFEGDERTAIEFAPPADAEEASKLAMGSILVIHPGTFGKRVILVNSGKGKIME